MIPADKMSVFGVSFGEELVEHELKTFANSIAPLLIISTEWLLEIQILVGGKLFENDDECLPADLFTIFLD